MVLLCKCIVMMDQGIDCFGDVIFEMFVEKVKFSCLMLMVGGWLQEEFEFIFKLYKFNYSEFFMLMIFYSSFDGSFMLGELCEYILQGVINMICIGNVLVKCGLVVCIVGEDDWCCVYIWIISVGKCFVQKMLFMLFFCVSVMFDGFSDLDWWYLGWFLCKLVDNLDQLDEFFIL